MARVSFLIVTHQAGRFLHAAVTSALAQSIQDVEVVVVDNASTDGSTVGLEERIADPRLRVVRLASNEGPFRGALAGFPHCTGEVVTRLDADDVVAPHCSAVHVACFAACADVGAVASFGTMIDEHGDALPGSMPLTPACTSDEIARLARKGMPVLHQSLSVRRSWLERVNYRSRFFAAGDFDLVQRLTEQTKVVAVPLPLVHVRMHDARVTKKHGALQAASAGAIVLMGARRRAGLDERYDEELTVAEDIARGRTRGQAQLAYADRLAAEGFRAEAAYLARQSMAELPSKTRWARIALDVTRALGSSSTKRRDALARLGRAPYDAAMP